MKTAVENYLDIVKSSAFNKSSSYSVNVSIGRFFKTCGGVASYSDALIDEAEEKGEEHAPEYVMAHMTPEFQRANTKWSQQMQIQFIENLLCGCQSVIQLFEVRGDGAEFSNCKFLDGLQRSTAIQDFVLGKFRIFNGLVNWEDIKSVRSSLRLKLSIYSFDSEVDACKFYIQMNKGMTHNEEDLKTAYAFLEKYKQSL